jgi:hypothetical protein
MGMRSELGACIYRRCMVVLTYTDGRRGCM